MLQLRTLFLFLFLMAGSATFAQEPFIIEGDTLMLKREVNGPLSLYWNEESNNYRYFVQKGDRVVELENSRVSGEEKRRYQLQLEEFTRDARIYTGDVKFVLYSLRYFVNRYNSKVQEDYVFNTTTPNIQQRVGLFVGLSNNRYTRNPENILAPVAGLEYELYDPNLAPRHSAFFHLRQGFTRQEYHYSSTQLSLNYRFKVLYFPGFDVHIDTEVATFFYSEDSEYIRNDQGEIIDVEERSGFSFTAPLSFGVGADIRITDQSFITLGYNDVVAIVLNGNGFFPLDFTIGYKYNL